jgi:hypothetical protein
MTADLTLQPRNLALTLKERSVALTLKPRTVNLTLGDVPVGFWTVGRTRVGTADTIAPANLQRETR